jgi:hypothetical protein
VTILVPLERSVFASTRPNCILQTHDQGPGIIDAP